MFVEDNASFVLVCTLMIDVSFSKETVAVPYDHFTARPG
jgi:hypothetical protein